MYDYKRVGISSSCTVFFATVTSFIKDLDRVVTLQYPIYCESTKQMYELNVIQLIQYRKITETFRILLLI